MINNTSGFEEIFTKHNLSDQKIYSILNILINSQTNLTKNQFEILNQILKSYEKIISGKRSNADFFFNDYDKLEISKIEEDYNKLVRYFIYRYKYKTYPLKKIVSDYPPSVQIEPSSVCNFRCIMCYQKDRSFSDKKNNFMGFMDYDLFKKIIDEIEGKVEAIIFLNKS